MIVSDWRAPVRSRSGRPQERSKERRKPRTARVGIFGVGYHVCWNQFPGLLDELMNYVSRNRKSDKTAAADENQLPLFVDPARELIAQLAGTQVDALTPMQAFDLLRQWKEKYGR